MRLITTAMLLAAAPAAAQTGTTGFEGADARATAGGAASLLRGSSGESGDIPGCVYGDSFDSYLGPDGSGVPETSFDGIEWAVVGLDWAMAVDNEAAQTLPPSYEGPAGGPDPMGVRGGMLSVQRASWGGDRTSFPISAYISPVDTYASTPEQPLFVTVDLYKPSHLTFQNWRPQSLFEGVEISNMNFGGFLPGGEAGALADMFGAPDVNEGAIVLAPDDPPFSQLVVSAHVIPEHGWFTAGVLVSRLGYSVWVRDRTTLADDLNTGDGPDYKTPMRDSGPFAGTRQFSEFGYGLEEGWVQIYPGHEDDAGTPDVIEGAGLAVNEDGEDGPFIVDASGNRVGEAFGGGTTVTRPLRMLFGLDPSESQAPGYELEDWWIDNLCVRGVRLDCPGDIDGDGTVGSSDLGALISAWGSPTTNLSADVNRDGDVDSEDLGSLISMWGPCDG